MTCYVDVLIAVNLLFTYLFLVLVRVILTVPTNKYAVALGSFLGGISSLIIFLGDKGLIFSVVSKLLIGAVIVFVAFLPKSLRLFLKELFVFFSISLLFGGAMYALELTRAKDNFFYFNGTVYFNISLTFLILSILLIYGVFLILNYAFTTKNIKNEIFSVDVFFRDTVITLEGFLDTGNSSIEPFSSAPVFVGELKALSPFFTYEEIKFLKGNFLEAPPKSLENKIRIIPFKTAGDGGLMAGFKPDKAVIKNKNQRAEIKDVYIALSLNNLSDGEYNIILNKSILDLNWRAKNEK